MNAEKLNKMDAACSPRRRPPCALMTASAAMHADCAALKKLTEAGMEVVVVQDADFEASLRIVEKVRRETANNKVSGPEPAAKGTP